MLDAERELDQRACLTEKDVRVDAGERGLPELGDGGLLAVARFDLAAQTVELGFRVTDQVKLWGGLAHLSDRLKVNTKCCAALHGLWSGCSRRSDRHGVAGPQGDITVMVDSSTEIRRHGDHLGLSDIKVGNQVEAEGTMADARAVTKQSTLHRSA